MGSSNVMALNSGATLEYDINISPIPLEGLGKATIAIGILPTQDIYPARGLRLGVQIDEQPIQMIDARQGLHDEFGEYTPKNLAQSKNLNHVGEGRATPAEMAITRAVLMAVAAADVQNKGFLQAAIDSHRDDLTAGRGVLRKNSD